MKKGFKTHRHGDNPKEQEIHNKFVGRFSMAEMDMIILPPKEKNLLTDREVQIVITAIQWCGTPVGQGFLRECGFEIKE